MAAPASLIPASKAALVTLIRAAVSAVHTPPAWPVHYGMPHDAAGHRVEVRDTQEGGDGTRSWRSLKAANPASTVDEVFRLPVIIYRVADSTTPTMQEVVEEAFAVHDLISIMLRTPANVTLGVAGVVHVLLSTAVHEEVTTAQGFGCIVRSLVEVTGRI